MIQKKISIVFWVVKSQIVLAFQKKHLLKYSSGDVLTRMSFLIGNFPYSLFCLRSGRTGYRAFKHRQHLVPKERHNDTNLYLPHIGDRCMPEIVEIKPFGKPH